MSVSGRHLGAVRGGAVAGGLALAGGVRGLAAHHARRREHAARAARRVLVAVVYNVHALLCTGLVIIIIVLFYFKKTLKNRKYSLRYIIFISVFYSRYSSIPYSLFSQLSFLSIFYTLIQLSSRNHLTITGIIFLVILNINY